MAAARGFGGCPVQGPGRRLGDQGTTGAARERAPREREGASVEEEKPGQTNLRLSLERCEGLNEGRRASPPPFTPAAGGPGRTTGRVIVSRGLGNATPARRAAQKAPALHWPLPAPQGRLQAPPAPMPPLPPRRCRRPALQVPGPASRPQAPAGLHGLSPDFPQQRLELGPSLP